MLGLAARRPDLVGSAVVYEPPLAWSPEWPHHGTQPPAFRGVSGEEAAESFLRRMIGDERYERLPVKTRDEVLKDGDALVAELTAIRLDGPPYDPAQIEVPVLVGGRQLRRSPQGSCDLSGRTSSPTAPCTRSPGRATAATRAIRPSSPLSSRPPSGSPPTPVRLGRRPSFRGGSTGRGRSRERRLPSGVTSGVRSGQPDHREERFSVASHARARHRLDRLHRKRPCVRPPPPRRRGRSRRPVDAVTRTRWASTSAGRKLDASRLTGGSLDRAGIDAAVHLAGASLVGRWTRSKEGGDQTEPHRRR